MRRGLEPADLGDLGVEDGEAFAASTADDIVIRLEPGTLRVWDFADEAE